MAWVGFEPTIPVLERAKTFDALDSTATVIGQTGWLQNVIRVLDNIQAWRV
jgi:hypothetical protein